MCESSGRIPKPNLSPPLESSLNLSDKQLAFVDACRKAGLSSPAKRSDLNDVAQSMGMKYAPAWIVQNSELRAGRGLFIVPGLDDTGVVVDSPAARDAVEAAAEAAEAPASAVAADSEGFGVGCGTFCHSWYDRWWC
jgi:hypothetical protein